MDEILEAGTKVNAFYLGTKYANCTVVSYDKRRDEYTLKLPRSGKLWYVAPMWVEKARKQ